MPAGTPCCSRLSPHIGGAVRSDRELHPDFVTDTFSAFYPMAAASRVIQGLHLEDYGLRWRHALAVLGHSRGMDRVRCCIAMWMSKRPCWMRSIQAMAWLGALVDQGMGLGRALSGPYSPYENWVNPAFCSFTQVATYVKRPEIELTQFPTAGGRTERVHRGQWRPSARRASRRSVSWLRTSMPATRSG